jgi:hypothetical protein
MKAISKVLRQQVPQEGFPMPGVNGYAGEQDGSRVILTDVITFASKAEADQRFPNGVPDYVKLHWASYASYKGWQAVFGWWSYDPEEGDGNPFMEHPSGKPRRDTLFVSVALDKAPKPTIQMTREQMQKLEGVYSDLWNFCFRETESRRLNSTMAKFGELMEQFREFWKEAK